MGDVQYTAAYDAEGTVVVIDQARNRKHFTCIGCAQPMVARCGLRNTWHFAHKGNHTCSSESALHKATKQLLASITTARIGQGTERSPYLVAYQCPYCHQPHRFDLLKHVESVVLERQLGEVIPDLTLLNAKNEPCGVIEVIVTHAIDEAALAFYTERWCRPVLCIYPTWEMLRELSQGLPATEIWMTPPLCSPVRQILARYRERLTRFQHMTTAPVPDGRCKQCANRLASLTLYTIDGCPCPACAMETLTVNIEEHPGLPATPAIADLLAVILRRYWSPSISVAYHQQGQRLLVANRCEQCTQPLPQGTPVSGVILDKRQVHLCVECGQWYTEPPQNPFPYSLTAQAPTVNISYQLVQGTQMK